MKIRIGDRVEVNYDGHYFGIFQGESENNYNCYVIQRDDDPAGIMGGGQNGWYNIPKSKIDKITIIRKSIYDKLLE